MAQPASEPHLPRASLCRAKIYCRRRALPRSERGGASAANFVTFLQQFWSCTSRQRPLRMMGGGLIELPTGRADTSVSFFRINLSFYVSSGRISVSLTRRECKSAVNESWWYLLLSSNHWLCILVNHCFNESEAINGFKIMNKHNSKSKWIPEKYPPDSELSTKY